MPCSVALTACFDVIRARSSANDAASSPWETSSVRRCTRGRRVLYVRLVFRSCITYTRSMVWRRGDHLLLSPPARPSAHPPLPFSRTPSLSSSSTQFVSVRPSLRGQPPLSQRAILRVVVSPIIVGRVVLCVFYERLPLKWSGLFLPASYPSKWKFFVYAVSLVACSGASATSTTVRSQTASCAILPYGRRFCRGCFFTRRCCPCE